MASGFFNQAKADLLSATHNLSSGTYKVLLVQTGYTFNPDDVYVSAITGGSNYELNSGGAGSGYQAGYSGTGRKTLASLAVAVDNTNDRGTWDAADLTWTAINAGTARALVIYKPNTSDSDSKMICYAQFPSDAVTGGGDLQIVFSASGIAYLS